MNTTTRTETAAVASAQAEPTVLLWSQSQNALHIEPLSRMLESNRRAYSENRRMDYVPLVIGNDDLCHDIARAVRGTLIKRESGLQPDVGMGIWR